MQDPQAILSEIENKKSTEALFVLSSNEMAQLFSINQNILLDNLDVTRQDLKSLVERHHSYTNKKVQVTADFSKYSQITLAMIAKQLIINFQELISHAETKNLEIIKKIELTKNWVNAFELLCYFDLKTGNLLLNKSEEWVKNHLVPELISCRQHCKKQEVWDYFCELSKILLIINYKFTDPIKVAKNCHELFLYYFGKCKNSSNKDEYLTSINHAVLYAKAAITFDKKFSIKKYLQDINNNMADLWPEKALEFYSEFSKLIPIQENNWSEIIDLHNYQASAYTNLWNYSHDINYLEKSLNHFELAVKEKSRTNKLENPDSCLHMLVSLNIEKSTYFKKQNNQELTLHSLQHALQYAIANKEARKISDSYKALGKYYQGISDQAKNPAEQRENLKEAFYHFAEAANNLLDHLYQQGVYTSAILALPDPQYAHIDELDNDRIIFWTDRYETFINYYSRKDFETNRPDLRAKKSQAVSLPFFSHSANSDKDDSSKEDKLGLRRNKRTDQIDDDSNPNQGFRR